MTQLQALPEHWESMAFEDFLRERRVLMAAITRQGYDRLA
jgi:hypothetical protein